MTADGDPFVDYYDILRINPDSDVSALESAYRRLAKLFHPDHSATADVDKFQYVLEAYRTLRDPHERAQYDLKHSAATGRPQTGYFTGETTPPEHRAALADADVHEFTLRQLYRRRREHAQDPGVSPYSLQELLGCAEDAFDFHVWYLKQKGLIEMTEQGTLAITVAGVDHVIGMSRNAEAEKLRIAYARDNEP